MCQNDILHWVNTPTLDSCFGLVGHHQQGAECDPVESQPLNIKAYAQPLACGCKLSKITTLACAVTMTTSDHKTREKLLPTARDSESRTVDLAARTRCVKMTSQARSQGGFGGCGRTPFLGPKKKWMVSAFGSCSFRCERACTAAP